MNPTFSVFRKIDDAPAIAVHGQVATKPHIVELMLDLAGYHGDPTKRILDPGCGCGAFTVAAARRLVRSTGAASLSELADCILAIDKDAAAASVCRARLRDTLCQEGVSRALASRLSEQWVVTADFLEHEFDCTFDFVVGNPPYVRQEAIPKAKLEQYRANFRCFYDRADLYVAFFEKSLTLLSANGKLALICPDRFTRNNYGRKLRALIADRYCVEHVLDLAQASPFVPDVTCYPGIFVISLRPQTKDVDYFRLADATPKECELVRQKKSNGATTYHRYEGWFQGEEKWSIESPLHLKLLRRLEAEGVALGDASSGCKVGIGIATGADDIFIVDQRFDIEAELLMPLVTTKDVATGAVDWHGRCVINPFVRNSTELIDLKRFPRARAHFERHRRQLLARHVAQRDANRWYRTIDRIYPRLRRQQKLLIPDIKADSLIVLEQGRLYPHHNLYYVASEAWDLRALRTILRSSVARFFVWMYGVKMRGDFLRFQAQYLRRICVPRLLSVRESMQAKLLAADSRDDPDELDSLAANLYGLSAAELRLVKETAPPRAR